MPSSLSEIIRQKAFLESGGREPGQYSLDKVDKIAGTVQGISDRQSALIKERLNQKKLELESKGLERGLKPYGEISSTPIPGADPNLTTTENAQVAPIYKANNTAQTENYLWVNPQTRQTSKVEKPGFVRVSANTGATIAAGAEGIDLRKQTIKNLEDERNAREIERKDRMRADVVSKFNANPNVRKLNTSRDEAELIRTLANSGNPIGAASIPTFAARMAGEVGNLSEPDKAPFGGSRAIMQRLEQSFQQMADGQLTPENRAFVIDLTNIMEKRANERLVDYAKKTSKQYGQMGSYGTDQEIFQALNPDLGVEAEPIYAVNPETKQRIMSTDGGQTWQNAK